MSSTCRVFGDNCQRLLQGLFWAYLDQVEHDCRSFSLLGTATNGSKILFALSSRGTGVLRIICREETRTSTCFALHFIFLVAVILKNSNAEGARSQVFDFLSTIFRAWYQAEGSSLKCSSPCFTFKSRPNL